ncbi:MAG: hypothetical protein GX621_06100 [Pirellulaceae bacterium]|nr:hypothetical protein [Pirellulaceae bacterium]
MRSLHPRSILPLAMAAVFLAASIASAATVVWDGGDGNDPSLATAANWVGDTLPATGDDVQFDGNVNTSPVTGGANRQYLSLAFNEGAAAFTIGGSDTITLTLVKDSSLPYANTLVNNSNQTQTFEAPVLFKGTSTNGSYAAIHALSGDLVFNGQLSLNTLRNLRVVAPDHTIQFNGKLNASGTNTQSMNIYSGVIQLNADNSDTWKTRIGVNGTAIVQLNVDGAGGASTANTAQALLVTGGTENQGTLELRNDTTTNKWIEIQGRWEDIRNVAQVRSIGNNTLQGRIYTTAAAATDGYVNIDSAAGTLTLSNAIEQIQIRTQLIRFRGAGDIDLTGAASSLCGVGGTNRIWKVAKLGAGTLTYDSVGVTYTGDTAVFEGTLALTTTGGSALAGSPRLTVADGATLDVSAVAPDVIDVDFTLSAAQTLGGGGTVKGNVAVAAGGSLLPGRTVDEAVAAYEDSTGSLSINGDLALDGTLVWSLGALSEVNPGVDFDTLSVTGNVALGENSQLALDFSLLDESMRPDAATPHSFWFSQHSWKVIDAGDNDGGTNFAGISEVATPEGWSFMTVVGTGEDAGSVYLVYVPEPSMCTLLLLAAAGWLVGRGGKR